MYLGWEQVLTLSQPTPTPGPTAALLQLPAEAELGQRAEVSPLTQGRQRHSLKVVTSWFQEGSGLVGHRPHHNRRVILVPADHLLHHLQVVLQRHVAVALAAGPGGGKGAGHRAPSWAGWAVRLAGTHASTMPTPGLSSMTTIP